MAGQTWAFDTVHSIMGFWVRHLMVTKVHGAFTSLVSGGFTYFADHIGKRIGFDEAMANILEFYGHRQVYG